MDRQTPHEGKDRAMQSVARVKRRMRRRACMVCHKVPRHSLYATRTTSVSSSRDSYKGEACDLLTRTHTSPVERRASVCNPICASQSRDIPPNFASFVSRRLSCHSSLMFVIARCEREHWNAVHHKIQRISAIWMTNPLVCEYRTLPSWKSESF